MSDVLPARSKFYSPGGPDYVDNLQRELNNEKDRIENAFVEVETTCGGGGAYGAVPIRSVVYPNTYLEGLGYVPITAPVGIVPNVLTIAAPFVGSAVGYDVAYFKGRFWATGGNFIAATNVVFYSPDGINWTQWGFAPWASRYFHVSLVHQDKMFIFGGGGWFFEHGKYKDIWYLFESAPNVFSWVQATADGGFGQRGMMSSIAHFNGKYWMVGGALQPSPGVLITSSDVYSAPDNANPTVWTLETSLQFPARALPLLVVNNNQLFLAFGIELATSLVGVNFVTVCDVYTSSNGVVWNQTTSQASNVLNLASHSAYVVLGDFVVAAGSFATFPTNWVGGSTDGVFWVLGSDSTGTITGTLCFVQANNKVYGFATTTVYEAVFTDLPVRTAEGHYLYRIP